MEFSRQIKKAGYILKNKGPVELFRRVFLVLFRKKNKARAQNIDAYKHWIDQNEPRDLELVAQRARVFSFQPLISIVCPTYETKEEFFEALVDSLLAQTYQNWELCLADGGSSPQCREMLKRLIAQKNQAIDDKIKIVFLAENLGIALNTAEAVKISKGEFLAMIDHDDLLPPWLLYEIVETINQNKRADFLYSDEDKIDKNGRFAPHFKPDWSPDTLKSYNYITHLMVIKRELYEKVGGFRSGFDGSQDHDLALRATGNAKQVLHIPKILYHWRAHAGSVAGDGGCKDYAFEAGRKAVWDYCDNDKSEKNSAFEVAHGVFNASFRVRYTYNSNALVSIIIPNRDNAPLLKKCIDSIKQTANCNYEIMIIENNSKQSQTHDYYKMLLTQKQARIIQTDDHFNYSSANNAGAERAQGEFLLFLNNDVQAIVSGWMQAMREQAAREEIGAVGAKLLYENNKVQHAGVVVGMGGWADHVCAGLKEEGEGVLNSNHIINTIRNVSAVTGACMMVEKSKFENVGGFDEDFALCGSDVELCLRLLRYDYLNIYTPFARLYHLESETRKKTKIPEQDYALSYLTYKEFLDKGDPYYNINFDYMNKIPKIAEKIKRPIELNPYHNKMKDLKAEKSVVKDLKKEDEDSDQLNKKVDRIFNKLPE